VTQAAKACHGTAPGPDAPFRKALCPVGTVKQPVRDKQPAGRPLLEEARRCQESAKARRHRAMLPQWLWAGASQFLTPADGEDGGPRALFSDLRPCPS
jgi:hypothetical protein